MAFLGGLARKFLLKKITMNNYSFTIILIITIVIIVISIIAMIIIVMKIVIITIVIVIIMIIIVTIWGCLSGCWQLRGFFSGIPGVTAVWRGHIWVEQALLGFRKIEFGGLVVSP